MIKLLISPKIFIDLGVGVDLSVGVLAVHHPSEE
jgi:hypothetical protein